MKENYFVVHGREIHYKIQEFDIDDLDYYFENPRIKYILSRYPHEQVDSMLLTKILMTLDPTKDLLHEIEENGGLIEEILVSNNKVIEGNTRLCCYRRLHDKTKDDKWKYIRAKLILDPIEPQELFSLLSNYHIKGKNPWNPFSKAICIELPPICQTLSYEVK